MNKEGEISYYKEDKKSMLYFADNDGIVSDYYIQISDESTLLNLSNSQDTKKNETTPTMVKSKKANDIFKLFKFASDHTEVEWGVNRNGNEYTLGSTKQKNSAGSFVDYGLSRPDASIHSHPMTNLTEELFSMGYDNNPMYFTDKRNVIEGSGSQLSYVYFPNSRNIYYVGMKYPVFVRKAKSYNSFYWGTLNIQ